MRPGQGGRVRKRAGGPYRLYVSKWAVSRHCPDAFFVCSEVKEYFQQRAAGDFLGDAVLSIVVSDYLFHPYHHLAEGDLSQSCAPRPRL